MSHWRRNIEAEADKSITGRALKKPTIGPRVAVGQAASYMSPRRGAGAVERDGLESRCAVIRTVGSNPTLSANSLAVGISRQPRNANALQTFVTALNPI